MATSKGYECEFVDAVCDDFYCKKCNLVARRLSITNCCGESFCQSCIKDIQNENSPCPECGMKDFTTFEHAKNQRRIGFLHVYCSMKERGCDWSGALNQLVSHLDSDQDNCQYVDTKCPLLCHMTIPKNKLEQHVAQHCTKRPYVCQHCNFKATYEEIIDQHLAECKYVPLQCTNLCGVTCERIFMDDHMKTCRLEKVKCKFRNVGCKDQFRREDCEEHTRQSNQKHLTLIASVAVEAKKQLQQNLLEQDKKLKEVEEKLKEMVEEQNMKMEKQDKIIKKNIDIKCTELNDLLQNEKLIEVEEVLSQTIKKLERKIALLENEGRKLQVLVKRQQSQEVELKKLAKMLKELERKLQKQENNLENQNKKLNELEKKLAEQENREENQDQEKKIKEIIEKKLKEQKDELEIQFNSKVEEMKQMVDEVRTQTDQSQGLISKLSGLVCFGGAFVMKNFEFERAKDKPNDWFSPGMYTHGYKFCVGVDANGYGHGHGECITVHLHSLPGEYDEQLQWPVKATFTIELVHQQEGDNAVICVTGHWEKPVECTYIVGAFSHFHYHSELHGFLHHDTLYFCVSKVEVL